jgi:hypothetical protein
MKNDKNLKSESIIIHIYLLVHNIAGIKYTKNIGGILKLLISFSGAPAKTVWESLF